MLNLGRTFILSSVAAAPFYTPMDNLQGFIASPTLVFFSVAILMGVKWYFIVILIYTSLIVVLYLFICCLPNSVSSEKCLFTFAQLKKWFICFLLLIYGGYLHILDMNPLSDTWFTNMFFHSIGCLFTVVSFDAQKFLILM